MAACGMWRPSSMLGSLVGVLGNMGLTLVGVLGNMGVTSVGKPAYGVDRLLVSPLGEVLGGTMWTGYSSALGEVLGGRSSWGVDAAQNVGLRSLFFYCRLLRSCNTV